MIYLPYLGLLDLHHEEGRRALTAVEMIRSGDWFVPTVLDRLYFNKPPGFTWILVGFSSPMGGVHEWSVRLPSVLSVLGTAYLVYFFAVNRLQPQTRLLAALLFLFTFMTIEKGRLGEIEAAFALAVFASLRFLWQHFEHQERRFFSMAAGLCLGAAILIKGPPALLFFYGALLPYCFCFNQGRWLLSRHHAWIWLAALLPVSLWLIPFLAKTGMTQPMAEWGSQMAREGTEESQPYWLAQTIMIANTLFGFLPGSLLLANIRNPSVRRHLRWDNPLFVFMTAAVLIPCVVFFLLPHSRARYLLPIAPLLALLAAVVWDVMDQSLSEEKRQSKDSYLRTAIAFVALFTGISSLVYFRNAFFPVSLFAYGYALVLLLSAGAVWVKRWRNRSELAGWITVIVYVSLVNLYWAEYTWNKKDYFDKKTDVAVLSGMIPDEATLYTTFWFEYNLFFYIPNRVTYIPSLVELPASLPAAYVLSLRPPRLSPNGWSIVKTAPYPYFDDGKEIYLTEFRRKE